jgi:septum formation protein
VTFYSLSKDEIDRYVATGEPRDKAGAYAAQGYASRFIEKINGDFYTVVGMPLSKIYQEFKELKII